MNFKNCFCSRVLYSCCFVTELFVDVELCGVTDSH